MSERGPRVWGRQFWENRRGGPVFEIGTGRRDHNAVYWGQRTLITRRPELKVKPIVLRIEDTELPKIKTCNKNESEIRVPTNIGRRPALVTPHKTGGLLDRTMERVLGGNAKKSAESTRGGRSLQTPRF